MTIDAIDFPASLAHGTSGGPRYKTSVTGLDSGHERRNRNWLRARYEFDAAPSVSQQAALNTLLAFFHGCGGRAIGFLFKDRTDFTSAADNRSAPAKTDQTIGTGDGAIANLDFIKTYSNGVSSSTRRIFRVVSGSVLVAVDGTLKTEGTHYTVDYINGVVTFLAGNIPTLGQVITAGFEFRIPVRFDTDYLETALTSYTIHQTATVPIVEVKGNE